MLAIYHLTVKAYSRKDGHSSTAAAAYRAGVCIEDALTGETHDYTKRHGVAFSALCLPGDQTADRAAFWNRVEAHHKRGDAVTCREVPFAQDSPGFFSLRKAFACTGKANARQKFFAHRALRFATTALNQGHG